MILLGSISEISWSLGGGRFGGQWDEEAGRCGGGPCVVGAMTNVLCRKSSQDAEGSHLRSQVVTSLINPSCNGSELYVIPPILFAF